MKYTTLLAILLAAATAFAQGTPAKPESSASVNLSGIYQGTVKGQEQRVSLQLERQHRQDTKVSGSLRSGEKTYKVTEGSFKDGTLSLTFGEEAKFSGKVEGNTIAGDWTVGTEKRPIELKKVANAGEPVVADPKLPATTAAEFSLNGEWDAVADANGQPFPFALVLKVEGENVTGGSSSQLGEASIKTGTWKDGRLALQLEGQNGTIALTATVVEGKLSGEYDYAGQLQGKWVAIKKQ